ncbi:surface antigen family protein [Sphingomonas sp. S17]|uniref:BamA/TamA family outer membrane protein n=2 Tax=Sphingomonas paucimobilis TaxID=13689 RepID=A0A411LMP7_SPHPI|nr:MULTISPECIES: BamA/TamA family outer membrane protein [Sphingomonas]EGI55184.1 surface antigen family protein [Sphingomonas sp. S17]MBQ1480773.1 BamA/TamA family outer membrane protein [Sphingomonas sp.]MCM3679757.1 BamA/TamA family outer membrane protein [Sphingomonas paucimobilis]MDG5970850.1 BamA/TamA family outer membrane protein [Sphingomonas paucimobilis]NNG56835.1 BamA/TamA family outer membrane protein [Sphingomonas paucimobilis]
MAQPGTAPARGPDLPREVREGGDPQANAPIVPDAEFNAALPPLSGDINAPLEAMSTMQATQPSATAIPTPQTAPPLPASTTSQPLATGDTIAPVAPEDPQLAQPLTPLSSFDSTPLQTAADIKGDRAPEIRYDMEVRGLAELNLDDEFRSLSALRDGKGKASNATQVSARAREDEALAVRLMKSLGYYDATAVSTLQRTDQGEGQAGRLNVLLTATPGRLYRLSSITVKADPTTPPDLVRSNLPLKVGDPIEAARIQGAEANVSLVLPQRGYPFVKLGDRDILLEDQGPEPVGAYTLPVDTGPRSSFGQLTTTGDKVFDLGHLNVFPRFEEGQLYDSRLTDDLRNALVATGLFNGVAVEPKRTGRMNPDGTEAIDLQVTQTKGPARTLSGEAGYSTGQGVRAQASFTHRNLFPPEGALIASVIAGTQEQGLSGTFRRSNAGRRDRTFQVIASASHQNYDAFDAFIGTVAFRWSYDSTPIWQKKFTYAFGGELTGTNESVYDFAAGERRRGTYGIAAIPGQVVFDQSNDLLNPTRGYRLKLNLSPETSVRGAVRPYARTMVEGTFYYPLNDSLVIAGRARAGAIFGIERDDLAPSRRYYGGGGGSVRGYGFQRLGPFDPQGNPVGGRSLNEFALEARYRFGNFGIVPFVDAGNSYESTLPTGKDLRFGAGIGGRFYTNFGPLRVDVATPLNPRPGDGKVALYISIGQAF